MYPFPQEVSPAVKTHIEAQTDYLSDMSKSLFNSFQQMCNLNMQLFQTMFEETTLAGKQLMKADQPEVLTAAAARAQPASEKLRAYQQHLARLAADSQVELARVTEHHAQTTARTARALADEVARTASEQTERGMQAQQENVRRFADPFSRSAEAHNQMWSEARGPQTMQSGGHGSSQGGGQGGNSQHAGGAAQQSAARAPEHS